jgi:hypothetical protein
MTNVAISKNRTMSLYKGKYRIESARLSGWDYSSPGYYFITVCTNNRECLFGHIDDYKMRLNDFGKIVQNEWDKSFIIRRELLRDEFVVMPNHFHGIVRVVDVPVPVVAAHVAETSGRTPPDSQLLIYQTLSGNVKPDVHLESNTVWPKKGHTQE